MRTSLCLRHSLLCLCFFLPLVGAIFLYDLAIAGSSGLGVHSGYGVVRYKEKSTTAGHDQRSAASMDTVIFGMSGEYAFGMNSSFFAGITTDWTIGLNGDETFKRDGSRFMTGNLDMYGQFYDLRAGYKKSVEAFYYRIYVSGGWDGVRFRRDDLVKDDTDGPDTGQTELSLWRTGIGAGAGYRVGLWALDARAAYSYYPEGKGKSSEHGQEKFDLNGTCLDAGIGLARKISGNMNVYIGISYTLLRTDESRTGEGDVFPRITTEMLFGMMNLTYGF